MYSLCVPILDRPEERPQCQGSKQNIFLLFCSNPRSPRRATAILNSISQPIAGGFQSSIAPKSDRNCAEFNLWGRVFLFQSSIAPKSDRNQHVIPVDELHIVPILDRPEERPQFIGRSSSLAVWMFQSSIAPKSDRNLTSVG